MVTVTAMENGHAKFGPPSEAPLSRGAHSEQRPPNMVDSTIEAPKSGMSTSNRKLCALWATEVQNAEDSRDLGHPSKNAEACGVFRASSAQKC